MKFKICVLGSGSSGNCVYINFDDTSILIDAGLSGKETKKRLEQIEVDIDEIQAVCISHEHGDHTVGLGALHRRHKIPVFANSGTVDGLKNQSRAKDISWNVFTTGNEFSVGGLLIHPFSVPHDAYEPVGFVVETDDKKVKLGIATDIGIATALARERLKKCDVLIIESNHDEKMLEESDRPWFLKQRIRGRQGHLSNTHAAEMVSDIICPKLNHVFLAHLSRDCNCEKIAHSNMRTKLDKKGYAHVKVSCTYSDKVSEIWEF